jgi:hypothetical protein
MLIPIKNQEVSYKLYLETFKYIKLNDYDEENDLGKFILGKSIVTDGLID